MENITTDVAFALYFYAIIADFITGIIAAAKEGRLKSRSCSEGIFRTIGEFIVLIILYIINLYLPSMSSYTTTAIMGFIIVQGISLVENLIRMGVVLPGIITKWFAIANEQINTK